MNIVMLDYKKSLNGNYSYLKVKLILFNFMFYADQKSHNALLDLWLNEE